MKKSIIFSLIGCVIATIASVVIYLFKKSRIAE